MRILITGVGGFVGKHLCRHILDTQPDSQIHGLALAAAHLPDLAVTGHVVDLQNPEAVQAVVAAVQPDQIYHLAAQASPRRSFIIPWDTLKNNIQGQLNLILACLALNLRPRILVVSSAEIYGPVQPHELPIGEDTPLRPTNPYGVSKVAQDLLGLQYYLSHRLPIIRVRPFNHTGPGQSEGFVATDFAAQIARIELGQQEPVLRVGNLAAQRDFSDVRDVVRAYGLLLEHGTPGDVYNLASGRAYSIQELLSILVSYSSRRIEVQVDPARMMPIDVPLIVGDATRLREATGWAPTIPFEQTLLDVLNDWRQRIQAGGI